MNLTSLLFVAGFIASACSSAIPTDDSPYNTQVSPGTIPQATPTGKCSTTLPSQPASEREKALAGCHGISLDGMVRNDIIDGICRPYILLFARGISELGNIGQVVGPPLALALEKEVGRGNVAVQGVNDYPATGEETCAGGSITGSQYLTWLVERTMVQCPDSKLIVSGYSQGAQVVHNAAEILKEDPAATDFIDAVVMFGHPDHKLPVGNVPENKIKVFCHE